MPSGIRITKGKGLSVKRKRQVSALQQEARKAIQETAKAGKKTGQELSSGTAYKVGRDPGYPYSKRENRPPGPPAIANMQTKSLRNGWRYATKGKAHRVEGVIYNISRNARFFGGEATRYMIARPLKQELLKRLKPIFQANVKAALQRFEGSR